MKSQLHLLIVLLAATAGAQPPALTTVSQTVYDQFGGLYAGPLTISLSTPAVTSGTKPVLSVVKTVQIKAGVLNVALVPNDTATPAGGAYVFAFGNGATKTCTFPTSGTAVRMDPYCSDNAVVNPAAAFSQPAPASPASACKAGNWADDAGYHYVCVSTDTWRRAALNSWQNWSSLTSVTWAAMTPYLWSYLAQ